jgi:hypothetical protein
MKLDEIEDAELRKALANMQLAYWDECQREAAELHPNWKITGEGRFKHNGKRTGPRTLHTLLNWFLASHPDRADQIRDRFTAMLRFSGKVTVRRDRRN